MDSDFMNKREMVHNGIMEFSFRRKTFRNILKGKNRLENNKTLTS
jgi:hypothetical protein